jgi:hypothetical protein
MKKTQPTYQPNVAGYSANKCNSSNNDKKVLTANLAKKSREQFYCRCVCTPTLFFLPHYILATFYVFATSQIPNERRVSQTRKSVETADFKTLLASDS